MRENLRTLFALCFHLLTLHSGNSILRDGIWRGSTRLKYVLSLSLSSLSLFPASPMTYSPTGRQLRVPLSLPLSLSLSPLVLPKNAVVRGAWNVYCYSLYSINKVKNTQVHGEGRGGERGGERERERRERGESEVVIFSFFYF